jgi:hypothetical protein
MKCEIFRNGNKIAGPMEFDPKIVRDVVARQGGNMNLVPPRLTSAVQIATIDIKPVVEVKPNLTKTQKHGQPTRTEEPTLVTYTFPVVDKTVAELRAEYLKRLSDLHEKYEQDRFEYNGILIKADFEARINVMATLDLFTSGAITSTEWRGKVPATGNDFNPMDPSSAPLENGRIELNSLADAQGVYGAIVSRLNAGFTARSAIEQVINSSTLEALTDYNVRSEFEAATTAQ